MGPLSPGSLPHAPPVRVDTQAHNSWSQSPTLPLDASSLRLDERRGGGRHRRADLLPQLHGQHCEVHELLQDPQVRAEQGQDLVRVHLAVPRHAG